MREVKWHAGRLGRGPWERGDCDGGEASAREGGECMLWRLGVGPQFGGVNAGGGDVCG